MLDPVLYKEFKIAILLISICDAAHEKVANGQNGVISTVAQRTCQGI